nr:crotonase/enoyl-CoA hydratase family protein [Caldimonas sp.]
MTTVRIDRDHHVWTVTIERPEVRNAVDGPTARALADAFRAFDADAGARVAVLTGAGGQFCAGADLRAVAGGSVGANALALDDDIAHDGPMGPTRLELAKPVIAAVEGFAVAGGLELALWCDARVAAATATFGVFCRRFGVPLVDGGTVRLPRLIGESRAMELILTGRAVGAEEALAIGLVCRVVAQGQALAAAQAMARAIAAFPQACMRNDRLSVRRQHGLATRDALAQEFALGRATLASGEAEGGALRFVGGEGRHGG